MEQGRNILQGKLRLPLEISDWAEMAREYYCVDKTLFIQELVDRKTKVALFTRPRRFGKSTALEMVRTFFEKTKEDTGSLFHDKKIWSAGATYRALQGKYPVIYLTFKDHKWPTWEAESEDLIRDVGYEVARHEEAILSNWGDEQKRSLLQRVKRHKAPVNEMAKALGLLAEALHTYHGVKPMILIDEYDQPITSASMGGYYDEAVEFMRIFLSSALKDNKHCEMGLLTGVLRVAKEGIFSGLNNLDVWTVFESDFSEYFGYTEEEVREMLEYYEVPEKMDEIKAWYDGYSFGGREMYNPWSVNKYLRAKCTPKAYWVDTSSNDLVLDLLRTYPKDLKQTLLKILNFEEAVVPMTTELGPYNEVLNRKETIYALLVSTGYLKVTSPINDQDRCAVALPNKEISKVFVKEIKGRINEHLDVGTGFIADALTAQDPVALQTSIGDFLRESVSFFDTATEGFYHGLTLGFLAILRDKFRVDSNGESGDGRFDIALTPRNAVYPGFILEVKKASGEEDDLRRLAESALRQIDEKDYAAKMERDMRELGNTQGIVKMGLAYWKKKVELVQG